jgi:hypothetical protein
LSSCASPYFIVEYESNIEPPEHVKRWSKLNEDGTKWELSAKSSGLCSHESILVFDDGSSISHDELISVKYVDDLFTPAGGVITVIMATIFGYTLAGGDQGCSNRSSDGLGVGCNLIPKTVGLSLGIGALLMVMSSDEEYEIPLSKVEACSE